MSSDLFPSHTIISSSHTHTHTHLVISHLTFTHTQHNYLISSHTHTQLVISSSDTHTHTLLLISHIHSQLHLFALLVTPHIRSGRRSIQSLQKGLRRALSPLGARLSPQWPAQCPETAEGAAARVVTAGGPALSVFWLPSRPTPPARPSFLPSSVLLLHTQSSCHLTSFPHTQSSHHLTHTLILSSHIHTHNTIISSAPTHTLSLSSHHLTHTHTHFFSSHISTHNFIYSPFLSHLTSAVAGAVSRDCRRGCGARCRRWGPGSLRSGRRRLQRLQKGLRRALSLLGARLSPQWPAQSPETAEGAVARVVAAGGPALSAVAGAVSRDCRRGCGARSLRSGRRSLQRLQKGLRRALSPLGARLSPQWPAQYPETAEGGLRRALSPLGARLSPQWPAQSPETAEGAAARVVAAGGPALSTVAGAVSRDCRRGCGARCRRSLSPLGARLSPQWPAQSSETAEGAAARVVVAGGCGSVRSGVEWSGVSE